MQQVSNAVMSFALGSLSHHLIPQRRAFTQYLFVLLFSGFALCISSCQKDQVQGNLQKQELQDNSHKQELLASSKKQDQQNKCVPLKGEFTFYRSTNTGTGTASHMGSITLVEPNNVVTPNPDGSLNITGPATITAANGDEVYATHAGLIQFLGNGMARVNGKFTISGGTGRFDGATGSFDVKGLGNLALGTTDLTLQGTICY